MRITEAYRAEQEILHSRGNYGTASLGFGPHVSQIIAAAKPDSILDYGCGAMQNLAKVIYFDKPCEYIGYDPGVPEFATDPSAAELVVCIDVLEHVEPECLNDVLAHLKSLTLRDAFFTIHTGPAMKKLSDGRNAHLIQRPGSWWFDKLSGFFEVMSYQRIPSGCFFIMKAL